MFNAINAIYEMLEFFQNVEWVIYKTNFREKYILLIFRKNIQNQFSSLTGFRKYKKLVLFDPFFRSELVQPVEPGVSNWVSKHYFNP